MSVSPPSSENRFWPTYLVCRNFSNSSAWWSVMRMRYFCRKAERGRLRIGFIRVASHRRTSSESMCMYSTPIVPAVGLLEADRSGRRAGSARPRRSTMRAIDGLVEVGLGEAEVIERQLRAWRGRCSRERVDAGLQVTGLAVPEDEPDDTRSGGGGRR